MYDKTKRSNEYFYNFGRLNTFEKRILYAFIKRIEEFIKSNYKLTYRLFI